MNLLKIVLNLKSLTFDSSGKYSVSGHDSTSLGMYGAEVHVLVDGNEI